MCPVVCVRRCHMQTKRSVHVIDGDAQGKTCIIIDDMVQTGTDPMRKGAAVVYLGG